jgi:cytochrome c-type biogenesis protein CcmH/NrfG
MLHDQQSEAWDIVLGLRLHNETPMRPLRTTLLSVTALLCLCAHLGLAQSPTDQPDHHAHQNDDSRSVAELSRQVRANPHSGNLWFSLGIALAQNKENDRAIQAFEKALTLTPDKAPIEFNLGLLYMESGDTSKAEDAYLACLRLDPSNIRANQNLAFLLMQHGQFEQASVPLSRLRTLEPADVSVRASLIEACLKAGMTEKGDAEIDDLLASRLATLPAGLSIARLLVSDHELDSAQRLLHGLEEAWPSSPAVHGELGILLAGRQKDKEAAQELGLAVQLDPSSLQYSLAFGQALIDSEQFPEALRFLTAAQSKFENQPGIEYQLALTDVCLQRFHDAISLLENLETQRPDSSKVQFLLGGAHELVGDLQKAEQHYRNAIRLAPQDPACYRVLASLLQKQGAGHLAESEQLARHALALDPADTESRIVLAQCLEKQGNLTEAAALLEQAVAASPSSRRAHSALAQLYRRQHNLARAEQEQSIAAGLEEEKIAKDWTIWGAQPAAGP